MRRTVLVLQHSLWIRTSVLSSRFPATATHPPTRPCDPQRLTTYLMCIFACVYAGMFVLNPLWATAEKPVCGKLPLIKQEREMASHRKHVCCTTRNLTNGWPACPTGPDGLCRRGKCIWSGTSGIPREVLQGYREPASLTRARQSL